MSFGDATLPLQKAIIAALKADDAVSDIVGTSVVDVPIPTASYPYISIGPTQAITEVADEYEGSETTIQLDGWVAGPHSIQAKRLGRAIRTALHEKELALDEDQRLVSLTVDDVRYLSDPDGITQHVAVTVTALTEPSD